MTFTSASCSASSVTLPSGKATAVKNWIYLTCFASWLSPLNASLAFALAFIAFTYGAMWVLYKKGIFLKA